MAEVRSKALIGEKNWNAILDRLTEKERAVIEELYDTMDGIHYGNLGLSMVERCELKAKAQADIFEKAGLSRGEKSNVVRACMMVSDKLAESVVGLMDFR